MSRGSAFAEIEEIYSAGQTHVDTDLRESPTPPYALLNARVGGSFGHARFSVGLSNLLDRTYVEHLSYQRDPFRTGSKVYEPGGTSTSTWPSPSDAVIEECRMLNPAFCILHFSFFIFILHSSVCQIPPSAMIARTSLNVSM